MKVALFLDVDKTLTTDYIQHVYARELGCEKEYQELEARFQDQKISSTEFGNRIIKLFADRGFTEQTARQIYDKVELQPWTEHLLELDVDKYLVSRGPNYYIQHLAFKHGISKDNICNSEYKFNQRTNVICGCDAINEQSKVQFVRRHLQKYDLTIGVGDNPEFDAPFISACTIPLMTVRHDSYIYVPTFQVAILLIENILKINVSTKPINLHDMRIQDLVRALDLRSWIWVFGALSLIFSAGLAARGLLPHQ